MKVEVRGSDGEVYQVQVDERDAWTLKAWSWRVNNRGYVHRKTSRRVPGLDHPECFSVYLHRFLVSCPEGFVVDHVNGDTLDNRRTNLEVVTVSENNRRAWVTRR